MKLRIHKVPLEPGKLTSRCLFSCFKTSRALIWVLCPLSCPSKVPAVPLSWKCPSLMSSLGWAGFCAVAVSHGCRKPCQGQAKGVGGSSLIKAGSSAFQPQGTWLGGAEALGGEYSPKISRRQISGCGSEWKCCVWVLWCCSKQGYIKHSSCSLRSGAGAQHSARAQRGVLQGFYKEFPRGELTWSLMAGIASFECVRRFSIGFTSGQLHLVAAVSALGSAECGGSFGEERVTSGARAAAGQHPWALNPLQQNCCCSQRWIRL